MFQNTKKLASPFIGGVILVFAGLLLLYYGAEYLVTGSSRLALSFGVRPLVVGLTWWLGICATFWRSDPVQAAVDVLAIEQATEFRGRYFVLLGRLSPLDGIGPDALGLDRLAVRLQSGEIGELILATNPTVEGEATAHYIAELARDHGVRLTRIAHGVPMGGELEYIDGNTLSHAFAGRQDL